MTIEIKVPSLGESVTEATVAKWYKNVGDVVKADEILVEIETDKVTLEVNAPCAGVLEEISFSSGDTITVGDVLGAMSENDTMSENDNLGDKNINATLSATLMPNQTPEVILSPAAKKIAAEKSIKPASLQGTGKNERVTKADVLAAINATSTHKVAQTMAINPVAATNATDTSKRTERIKMSRLRQKIAQRLKESQNTAAILTTFNEIDMTNIINMRNQYKDVFEKKHGVKLGFMSFFLKAAIGALKAIPAVNAEIDGEDLIYKNYYDIGVAVGTEQGLVVPVVRDADTLSFAGIEKAISELGKKAREGKLTVEHLTGGTFTISNGGVYGSLLSTPIINPPQAAILGMHKTQDRPMAIDGKVEIRPMMYLALSYDHRIIDGKEAVTFLVKIKETLENPERILFEI
jgi:2-oxoglutarate dehydrogenase E2 component (dihydrolipoamide succinyltransferase)